MKTKTSSPKCRICPDARHGAKPKPTPREAQDAIAAWLQTAEAAGRAIPKPSIAAPVSRYSGKFLVPVPRSLHARLAREAEQQGVSLNQWAATKLAQPIT